jgi:regulator of sirC expression with transglutaminase-like and TPR domain
VDPEQSYRSGVRRFATGDTIGAKAAFEGVIAANPRHAPSWRALGFVYEKRGDRTRARTAFARYLTLAPNARDARTIRGRLERLRA